MFELNMDFSIYLLGKFPIWNKNFELSISLDNGYEIKRERNPSNNF